MHTRAICVTQARSRFSCSLPFLMLLSAWYHAATERPRNRGVLGGARCWRTGSSSQAVAALSGSTTCSIAHVSFSLRAGTWRFQRVSPRSCLWLWWCAGPMSCVVVRVCYAYVRVYTCTCMYPASTDIHPELSDDDDRRVVLTHSGMASGINAMVEIQFS